MGQSLVSGSDRGLSLGAKTAAEQGALFFRNVVNEHSSSPRMLIVHEVPLLIISP
ncbi:hypothetical protein T484DRAFT_1863970 [Baffinella frigidus]|nr:hypothetical protein T484DRAFT_1863970 [Cryptophyta sp. CCMP2293]